MAKSTSLCNLFLALFYNGTAVANVADNAASSPMANVHVSLHTGALIGGSTQATNETAYTNYARQPVARTSGGWSVPSGGATSNVAAIEFPQCGVTGSTITHASTGKDLSGAGIYWHSGALNSAIAVANNIQPRFSAGAMTITET